MSTMVERLTDAAARPEIQPADRTIGRLLVEAGKLKPGDAERALRLQKERGIRFGEACMQLKLVSQGDIDAALSRQFDYPYLRPGEATLSHELVAAYEPFSRQVEALRALRTQLLLRWFTPERRLLAIASPTSKDGRTYLAANLAVVFSQLGERTLLIDADMRFGRQHSIFRIPNQYGLSALLAGRVNGSIGERVGHFTHLTVLPAGAAPPNPLELLSRPEFTELLLHESRNFDVVLIDTPAAELAADAQAISARAGGALMVARDGYSKFGSMGRLSESLRSTHAEVVGCVLNHS